MTTWGWRSHYYPLVPFAWALMAAGHEVRVATQPSLVPAVTSSGVPAVAVGPDLDFTEVFRGLANADSDGDASITADGGTVRYAAAMVDDLVGFGRFWQPDLVVHEPFNLAGAIAAQVLGVPVVKHLWGADFTELVPVDESVATGDLVTRFGLARLREESDLVLDPCPAAIQVPPGRSTRLPMRFVPYNGKAEHPAWLSEPAEHPRVCVTWGTLMSELDSSELFLAPKVVDALSGLDLDIVIATTPDKRPDFGPLPKNVRFADAPLALHLVLPSCAAVIHQGGAGTTMTAMAAGTPQLILPRIADQLFNAERLAGTGAGMVGELDTLAAQVGDLTAANRWSEAARLLAAGNASRPSPAQVVAELPELIGR
ncbi:nucleotide disphospho-sugar-binding domain-containing protein [Amycolatopsis sp. cg5]|uniref:nucleotide disphospho-sugar-binding domain-containing protein n=1 Tax=Amycolatopsis sp. cg5 TaxID=3238802 RepID=UPI0035255AB5